MPLLSHGMAYRVAIPVEGVPTEVVSNIVWLSNREGYRYSSVSCWVRRFGYGQRQHCGVPHFVTVSTSGVPCHYGLGLDGNDPLLSHYLYSFILCVVLA